MKQNLIFLFAELRFFLVSMYSHFLLHSFVRPSGTSETFISQLGKMGEQRLISAYKDICDRLS